MYHVIPEVLAPEIDTATTSADIPVISSTEEADVLLARIAGRQRNMALIETALAEDMATLKARAQRASAEDRAVIAGCEAALARFAGERREALFRVHKTLPLTFGSLGFRTSTSVQPLPGWTWDSVRCALESAGYEHCLRIRREVDKQMLKNLSTATLRDLGCDTVREDSFYYRLTH